ncbi:MAG TPA: cysteine synthase family protein [Blastocatellia bacterium]|jgi:cysteine synthase A|nr:cysteine synthase family protein [Blastocatellia bacterium]
MFSSVIEAIGRTPLVELRRFSRRVDGRILAKLENLNPGASKKDRIALQMVDDAERAGALRAGQTIVELTSGNTGTGLAIVCAVKGYPFVAVMSQGNSPERARMMAALGAEVVLVPQAEGSVIGQVSGGDLALVEETTQRIVKERGAFRADQFRLASNFRAHYLNTGPEILAQSPYPIDLFCDFVGSGGTFAGCAAALKEANSLTRCFIVEPAGAAVLSGRAVENPRHRIQGGGYAMTRLEMIGPEHIDGFVQVTDEEAIASARDLARTEGIFAGYSSGANLAAAVQLLEGESRGKTAVIIICDSGLKYLSTDLWQL